MSGSPHYTIRAQGLSRQYGNRIAVHNLNLHLERGEVLGFLGPNGAGKSTTMRMLTGNLAPDSGSVEICGISLLHQPRDAKMHIGYLPEIPPLYRELTVNEYLRFVARLHHISKPDTDAAIDQARQRCGLGDTGTMLISALSKGYQQRVGIAQAIIHSPDVVILDEPTAGLDPNQAREIRKLIQELGTTHSVILSTHILSEVEAVCSRVHIMHQGHTVLDTSMSQLKHSNTSLEQLFARLTAGPAQAASPAEAVTSS